MKILIILGLLFSLSNYSLANEKSLCSKLDDRILSYDAKVGRTSRARTIAFGCTATLIGKSCVISAGHCKRALQKVEFNVPPNLNGRPQAAAKEDIYFLEPGTLRYVNRGAGSDWAVFNLQPNKLTGKLPGSVQGYYDVDLHGLPKLKTKISITGFGIDEYNSDRNFIQQTNEGEVQRLGFTGKTNVPADVKYSTISHNIDTTKGNSGSAIIDVKTQKVIAIHTHGGCEKNTRYNLGTLISRRPGLKKAIQECLAAEEEN